MNVLTSEFWGAFRFWSKVDFGGGHDACWLWRACVGSGGYGQFGWRGKVEKAHRVAHRFIVGPIAPGLQVDHVKARGCKYRHCVNPWHLEAVTPQVNAQRSTAGAKAGERMQAKTHCPRGHEYTLENTWRNGKGERFCRACNRANAKKWRSHYQGEW